jgi:exodeoxyribonuclease-3
MKIVTWNVNGVRACYKKNLIQFVEMEKPDILCLQETKAHIDQVEENVRKLNYPFSYWYSAEKRGYSGVATYCRQEPKAIKLGIDIAEYDREGRVVITDFDKFLLYNIYFPNGGASEVRHEFKQKFLVDLNKHLKQVLKSGREIILVGDYNVAHKEIDVYDPVRLSKESGFLPEEREWFSSFLDLGFIDTFRYFRPNEKDRYSWWSYREFARVSNRGWRIDYICVSVGLKNKIVSADILDGIEGSDHCPVVLNLDLLA